APPADWYEVTRKWWLIHNVRFAIQLSAFILLTLSALSSGGQDEPRRKFIEDNALDVKNLDV
ncbi:MAG: hypothetical protein ABJB40_14705, partial [Acidobacteriota bacterium]